MACSNGLHPLPKEACLRGERSGCLWTEAIHTSYTEHTQQIAFTYLYTHIHTRAHTHTHTECTHLYAPIIIKEKEAMIFESKLGGWEGLKGEGKQCNYILVFTTVFKKNVNSHFNFYASIKLQTKCI